MIKMINCEECRFVHFVVVSDRKIRGYRTFTQNIGNFDIYNITMALSKTTNCDWYKFGI